MLLRNTFDLGTSFRFVSNSLFFLPYYNEIESNRSVYFYLSDLIDSMKELEISEEIIANCEYYLKDIGKKYVNNESEKLADIDRKVLENMLRTNEDAVRKELSKKTVFEAFTDGTLNREKLLSGAENFTSEDIWEKLQEIEKLDLDECAKCLFTQSWTAAGVMAVRALESGIKTYCSEYSQNYNDEMTFGQMINELKDSPNSDKKFVGYLDYLKDIRNDLAHPNLRLEQFDAAQVFQHTMNVLTKIYSWT